MTTEFHWLPLIPDRSSPADLSDVAVLAISDQLPALIEQAVERWPVLPVIASISDIRTNRYVDLLSVSRGVQATTNDSGFYAHAEVTCSAWSPRNVGIISAQAGYSSADANLSVMTNLVGLEGAFTIAFQENRSSHIETGNLIWETRGHKTPEIGAGILALLGITAQEFNPDVCARIMAAMLELSTIGSRSPVDMSATLRARVRS
jgi:hypothetical protein